MSEKKMTQVQMKGVHHSMRISRWPEIKASHMVKKDRKITEGIGTNASRLQICHFHHGLQERKKKGLMFKVSQFFCCL